MVLTASTGYFPAADSADSITASAPSKIAVATSETSARVGTGLAIIETGSGSEEDLLRVLDDVLPADDRWRHRHGPVGHGRDHLVPAFLPPYAVLPVVAGTIMLGTWQSICLVDPNRSNSTRQVRFSFLPG